MPRTRGVAHATDYPEVREAVGSLTPLEELERREVERAAKIHEQYRVPWEVLADALGITKKTLYAKRVKYDLP